MSGPNSKGGEGYETVKNKWTKISKIALGLECKVDTLHSYFSVVALVIIENVKKT